MIGNKPPPASPMAMLSAATLAGVTGLVAWSTLTRPIDPRMADVEVQASDFPTAAPAFMPPSASESMRDAMASPKPIPLEGYSMTPKVQAPVPEAAVPRVPPGVEVKVRRHPVFAELGRAPARFLLKKTALGSPRALNKFLADPKAVDAYLNSALVRAALKSPAVTKTLLANGALVRAFLDTPAMQDPVALANLLKSPMFRKMVDCPGPVGALSDPAVFARLGSDPVTLQYLAEHPQAADALAKAFPALARAVVR